MLILSASIIIAMIIGKNRKVDLVVDNVEVLGAGGYGAVFNAKIDPFNANYFGATCDMGSVYFSFDQGANWTRHNLLGTAYCLKYDQTVDGVVWVGGSGVYKSTDHGKTMKMVFPKPEEITSAGNNYENINYWLYTDQQSVYAPQYQIWSLAINRKSNGKNVFVAQKIPGTGLGFNQCIRIYQTLNGEDFTLFTELPYASCFKIDYDEVNDCLIYVTPNKIIEISPQKEIVYEREQPILVHQASGNVVAFDSYYDAEKNQNTFVFSAPVDEAHVTGACYKTNNLRASSYENLTEKLCALSNDDFGLENLGVQNQGLPSYEYYEWINGGKNGKNGYVKQQFKWTICNVSVLSDDVIYLFHEAETNTYGTNANGEEFLYVKRRTSIYLKYDVPSNKFTWVYGFPLKPYNQYIENTTWQDSDMGFCYSMTSSPSNDNALLFGNIVGLYFTADGKTVRQLNSIKQGQDELTLADGSGHTVNKSLSRLTTTGVDVLCTQTVVTDPFNQNHLLIGSTDTGLVQSYDNGQSWYHALYEWQGEQLVNINYAVYTNTCFDLHFDTQKPNVVYGLWSLAKSAPYAPTNSYKTSPARFGVSYDGGLSWHMKKITTDGYCLPYRMQVVYRGTERIIYVTTDSHGFWYTNDFGDTFVSMNDGIQSEWGNKLLICEMGTFAVTGGRADDPDSQMFYQWNDNQKKFEKIGLPTVMYENESYPPSAIRDMVYDPLNHCLYLACVANVVTNYHQMVQVAGGVWRYQNGEFTLLYDNASVCALALNSQNQLYAVQMDGKILRFKQNNSQGEVLLTGLFHRLKNICFGVNDKIIYVPTWGGGTYRITLKNA